MGAVSSVRVRHTSRLSGPRTVPTGAGRSNASGVVILPANYVKRSGSGDEVLDGIQPDIIEES